MAEPAPLLERLRLEWKAAPLAVSARTGQGIPALLEELVRVLPEDYGASSITGALVRGRDLAEAAQLAADFTSQCAERTLAQDLPRREGIDFEPLLWRLGQVMA